MSIKAKTSNINTLWAALIVEELRRCGVEYFCVAPGSRSAPLAVAVAENSKVQTIVHYDERSLGFHALGLTSATLKPTAIITTSGTAVANLLPSIIEASKKKLPLIVLTADRPPELRATGANQTIDQIKIFGDYMRFFFDVPCPTTKIAPEFILTTVDQAVSRSQGALPGPVHLNCMFREPLAPHQDKKNLTQYLQSINKWMSGNTAYTKYAKPQITFSTEAIQDAVHALKSVKNGIIAVGKLSGPADEEAVIQLAEKLNWPIFADVTSGLRLGQSSKHVIHHFDHILGAKWPRARKKWPVDGVLHFGGRLTSTRWLSFLSESRPTHYVMVLKHPLRHDPNHRVTLRLQGSVNTFCHAILSKLSHRKSTSFFLTLQKWNRTCGEICADHVSGNTLSEPAVAHMLSRLLPANSGLFIGNSMPIRELNLFSSAEGNKVRVTANRGASGIDGNIATAAGFAKAANIPCTAIIGDLAFLYDLNSLSLLQNMKHPFIVLVINNNGGAIFSFLPISQLKSNHFEKFFTTPHDLNFEHAAKLFGLSYQKAEDLIELRTYYQGALKSHGTTILELTCHRKESLRTHKNIHSSIAKKLR